MAIVKLPSDEIVVLPEQMKRLWKLFTFDDGRGRLIRGWRSMCNFFTRHREPRNLQAAFRFPELPNDPPRYVVRPTDAERVVAIGKDGGRHSIAMRWGLVPYWAKDIRTGLTTFNWRSEEFTGKRIFAEPFERGRRCLVPCDGFFEFTGEKGAKQPHLFKARDGRVMAFAGIWDQWRGPKDAPANSPLTPPLVLQHRDVCTECFGRADT